ncbi:unnamed protein product [Phytophthora lilii]|uniref:Unnamed protein product n=1 Tax=Phytophthora lilii TaxID=2077276 RepID=A0A9W6WUL3_9STRA|nr:unnamed protein product [Phytophthora lilii]
MRQLRLRLSQKMTWGYGTVPYLFGYVASGYQIQVVALVCASDGLTSVDTVRIGFFDLERIADRFRLVLALLNLSRLFSAIAEACPESGRDGYRSIHRSNGVVVQS